MIINFFLKWNLGPMEFIPILELTVMSGFAGYLGYTVSLMLKDKKASLMVASYGALYCQLYETCETLQDGYRVLWYHKTDEFEEDI